MSNKIFSTGQKISLLIIFVLAVTYVVQVQAIIQNAYKQRQYKAKAEDLSQQLQQLQGQYTTARSLDQLLPQISALDLQHVSDVQYIKLSTGQVAAK